MFTICVSLPHRRTLPFYRQLFSFTQKNLESVLRKYIRDYVTCHTCKSPTTILAKHSRLYFLQCEVRLACNAFELQSRVSSVCLSFLSFSVCVLLGSSSSELWPVPPLSLAFPFGSTPFISSSRFLLLSLLSLLFTSNSLFPSPSYPCSFLSGSLLLPCSLSLFPYTFYPLLPLFLFMCSPFHL